VGSLSRNPIIISNDDKETYENQEPPTIDIIKEDPFSKTPNALLFSKDLV
jgi:hypothetical protein